MTATVATELQVIVLAPDDGPSRVNEVCNLAHVSVEPFSEARQKTLAKLSSLILHDTMLRNDPASVAAGYWLRKSNVKRLAADFERRKEAAADKVLVPVGRVFHVAPGNVDTVFLYSWVLSYLCGNQNIVRVSGERSEILNRLLAVLSDLMREDAELAEANRFLTYEHDDAINEALSHWATHRVLWGGDESVSRLRSVPLNPHASERTFGSKFSYCVISADAYVDTGPDDLTQLASAFYNDIFWFDQMACSSPHVFVWVGSPERTQRAVEQFHTTLANEIERRSHRGAAPNAVHRLNHLFELASETEVSADLTQREFLSVRLADGEPWRKEICGAGFLLHARANTLREVSRIASQQDQTITHFGFSQNELFDFARAVGALGVDRLVPVGEALAFDTVWDGFDLIGDFVRNVSVKMQSVLPES